MAGAAPFDGEANGLVFAGLADLGTANDANGFGRGFSGSSLLFAGLAGLGNDANGFARGFSGSPVFFAGLADLGTAKDANEFGRGFSCSSLFFAGLADLGTANEANGFGRGFSGSSVFFAGLVDLGTAKDANGFARGFSDSSVLFDRENIGFSGVPAAGLGLFLTRSLNRLEVADALPLVFLLLGVPDSSPVGSSLVSWTSALRLLLVAGESVVPALAGEKIFF